VSKTREDHSWNVGNTIPYVGGSGARILGFLVKEGPVSCKIQSVHKLKPKKPSHRGTVYSETRKSRTEAFLNILMLSSWALWFVFVFFLKSEWFYCNVF
jgi:hypothetical protein